ncbi:MAG: Ig-like domain-containing protein [Candidatus Bipolaricaulota bacterium]
MNRWVKWAVLFVALGCVRCNALANQTPELPDAVVTVVQDRPELVRMAASDADLDPMDPQAHPLRFVLLEGPTHGALVGDLDAVSYAPPHEAWIELTYVPAAAFVGRDAWTLVVVDSLGAASRVATIAVDVVRGRAEGLLAGTWDAEFTFNVQSASLVALSQRITEVYRVGGLTLSGTAQFNLESPGGVQTVVFDALRFDSDLRVGDLDARATLAFDPQGASAADLFDYLSTNLSAEFLGVSLAHSLFLTRPQTASYQTLTASAVLLGVSVSSTVRLALDDACGFVFSRSDLGASWAWCDVGLHAALGFADTGFDVLRFSAYGIALPEVAWLPRAVTLNATLTFAVDQKSLDGELEWTPIRGACLRLLAELVTSGGGLIGEGVTLYGLVLDCQIGDVRVRSATSLDPGKNAEVTGQIDYFESLTISGTLTSCCGIPGTWSVATYFAHASTQLFDWGMLLAKADVALSEHVSFRLDVVFRSGDFGDPTSEFTVGWAVRW